MVEDITQQEVAEQSLRQLTGRLIRVQEEERSRIARELHDDLNQRLGLLAIELGQLHDSLSQGNHELLERLDKVCRETDDISEGVHRLSHNLHSSVLENLGLVPAVRTLCMEFSGQYGIKVEFQERKVPSSLSSEVALCLFRIVQECLRNVARHSRARLARVRLDSDSSEIRLIVEDDGVGFDLEARPGKPGLGLVSIRERVASGQWQHFHSIFAVNRHAHRGGRAVGKPVGGWPPGRRAFRVGSDLVPQETVVSRTRLLLADDHTLITDALSKLLEAEFEVVGSVADGRALLKVAIDLRADVVVLDIGLPLLNGLDAGQQLRERNPEIKIVYLTQNRDHHLAAEAFRRKASGYLLKNSAASELSVAIREAVRGRSYVSPVIAKDMMECMLNRGPGGEGLPGLTPRQREVLQLLAEGRSMKEVAAILSITTRTVEFHKYRIMELLSLKTNAELVQYAVRQGIVSA